MKTCGRCEVPKPLSEFGVSRSRSDGFNLYCKPCVRDKIAEYRHRRREWKHRQPKRKRGVLAKPPKPINDGSIDAGLLLLSLVAPRGIELETRDIAYVCGCTPGRIAQIERQAMRKLKEKILNDPRFIAA